MARAGIYIRRASKVDCSTLQAESEELKGYINKEGNVVAQTYIDNGYSGMNTNRPALKSLLDDCRNGKLDEVVILCYERLSRKTLVLKRLCNQFKECGVLLKVKASM